MPDQPPPPPEDDPQADRATLEAEKLRRDLRKLKLEIAKFDRESRGVFTRIGPMIALTAVIISAMQLGTAYWNLRGQREKNAHDVRVSCVNAGATLARLAIEKLGDGKLRDEEVIRYVNMVLATVPPSTAVQVLTAVQRSRLDVDPVVLDTLDRALAEAQAAAKRASDMAPCPALDGDELARAIIRVTRRTPVEAPAAAPDTPPAAAQPPTVPPAQPPAQPPTQPTPQLPPQPSAQATPPPAGRLAPNDPRMAVFTQIVEADDRNRARDIMDSIRAEAATWPGAPALSREPIELVTLRDPRTQRAEVRYYFRDQAGFAERLAQAISATARSKGIAGLDTVRVSYIGDRFPNLPRGRIEVWFPPLP